MGDMDTAYLLRIASFIVVAVGAWAGTAGLLLVLPPGFAVAVTFAGLVTFLVGAKLHLRWPAAVGGVLMFGGVFA